VDTNSLEFLIVPLRVKRTQALKYFSMRRKGTQQFFKKILGRYET